MAADDALLADVIGGLTYTRGITGAARETLSRQRKVGNDKKKRLHSDWNSQVCSCGNACTAQVYFAQAERPRAHLVTHGSTHDRTVDRNAPDLQTTPLNNAMSIAHAQLPKRSHSWTPWVLCQYSPGAKLHRCYRSVPT